MFGFRIFSTPKIKQKNKFGVIPGYPWVFSILFIILWKRYRYICLIREYFQQLQLGQITSLNNYLLGIIKETLP